MNSQQQKLFLVVLLLCLVVLGAGAYFYLMLIKPGMADKDSQIKKANEEIKKKEKELAEIKEFETLNQEEYDLVKRRLDETAKRLPDSRDAPGFLEALSKIQRSSGIDSDKITSEKLNEYDRFTEIPYASIARGRYHEFGHFLNMVEENERFMRVRSFSVTTDPARPSVHPINVGIATFMFEER